MKVEENDRNCKLQNQLIDHHDRVTEEIISLEQQIDMTIYNYEQILSTQKKTSTDRSQFLLYLIQSLRNKHSQQLETVVTQLQRAEGEAHQAQIMQQQMENISGGFDQIIQQSRKLQVTNQNLLKQMEQQQNRQLQLDQEIQLISKQLNQYRLKTDQWERVKLKWDRQKKQLLQMIEEVEHDVVVQEEDEEQNIYCKTTGQDVQVCNHCRGQKIDFLRNKYNAFSSGPK